MGVSSARVLAMPSPRQQSEVMSPGKSVAGL